MSCTAVYSIADHLSTNRCLRKRQKAEITKELTILKVISWTQKSWNDATNSTIKNCSKMCGFDTDDVSTKESIEEFEDVVRELCSETSVEEFINLDACVDTCPL